LFRGYRLGRLKKGRDSEKCRNTSLLSDEKFVQLMKTNLEVWKEEAKEFIDIRVAWDWIKYNVRLFSMQYSKEPARIKREKEESLQKKLQAAHNFNKTLAKNLKGSWTNVKMI